MDHTFCPGSKLLRQPEPEEFTCPTCGAEVEIWTDEMVGSCSSCQANVYRDSTMSCLDWCDYGKECVGEEAYDSYTTNKSMAVKRRLIDMIEEYFEGDQRRIDHAKRVLRFAEELLKVESEANWHIVIPASLLHDVGIKVAEEKYGSASGKLREREGPPIARKMILGLGFKLEEVDEICDIIAHHHTPGVIDTANFKVLYDADTLVNGIDRLDETAKDKLSSFVERAFLTEAGRELADRELELYANARRIER